MYHNIQWVCKCKYGKNEQSGFLKMAKTLFGTILVNTVFSLIQAQSHFRSFLSSQLICLQRLTSQSLVSLSLSPTTSHTNWSISWLRGTTEACQPIVLLRFHMYTRRIHPKYSESDKVAQIWSTFNRVFWCPVFLFSFPAQSTAGVTATTVHPQRGSGQPLKSEGDDVGMFCLKLMKIPKFVKWLVDKIDIGR